MHVKFFRHFKQNFRGSGKIKINTSSLQYTVPAGIYLLRVGNVLVFSWLTLIREMPTGLKIILLRDKPANIYLCKVSNKNTRTTSLKSFWHFFFFFFFWSPFLLFLLLTLNKYMFFLSVSETNSHNFATADKTLPVPKKIILSFLRCSPLFCLRLYGFCIKRKKTEIISG